MAVVRTHGVPATKVAKIGGLSEPRNSAPVSAMYKTPSLSCVQVHIFMGMYACMHICMWSPEFNLGALLRYCPPCFLWQGFSLGLKLAQYSRLASQRALGILLINLHIAGITRVCHHPWSVCGGVCDSRDLTQIFFTLVELCYLSLVKTPISWKKKGLDMVSHSCNPVLTVGWGAQSRRILSSRLN